MNRYELVEGTASKFWQWRVSGTDLEVEYGRIGTKGQSSLKSFATAEAAVAAADKLVREKVGKGYALVGEAGAAPLAPVAAARPAKAEAAAIPGGVTEAALKALAKKIETAGEDRTAMMKAATKAVADEGARRQVYWHLLREGLVGEAFARQLEWILGSGVRITTAEVPGVAAWLVRYGHQATTSDELLAGWSERMDALVFQALLLAPEVIEAREAELAPPLRRGLAFVRARAGRGAPPRAQALEILAELAKQQASYLTRTVPAQRDGATIELDLVWEQPGPVRELALFVGSGADWDAALLDAARTAAWSDPVGLLPALAGLPLAELGPLLAGHIDDQWLSAVELVVARQDPPAALLAAARALDGDVAKQRLVRQLFAIVGSSRLVAGGQPVPAEVAELIAGFELFAAAQSQDGATYGFKIVPPALAEPALAVLGALPAATVHELVRRRLDDATADFEHLVLPLVAHFDAGLLERLYLLDDTDHNLDPLQVSRIGLPLLAPLARIIDATPIDGRGEHSQCSPRYRTYLLAFARAAATGQLPDAGLDAHLRFYDLLAHEAAPGGVFEGLLAALPAARRAAVFQREISADPPARGARASRWFRLAGIASFLHLVEDPAILDEAIRRLVILGHVPEGSLKALGARGISLLGQHLHLAEDADELLGSLDSELDEAALASVRAAAKQAARTVKAADKPAPLPAYEGVSDRSLRALVGKLEELDQYQISEVLADAAGDDGDPGALGWHFVHHGLLQPQPSGELIGFLESKVDETSAPLVAELLARLILPVSGDLLPSWTWSLDNMVFVAYGLAPAAFRQHEPRYAPAMRLGLAFVRGRYREPLAPEVAAEIMRQLARAQATRGLLSNCDVPYLDGADGELVEHDLRSLDDVRTVALLFGSAADWDRLLAEEAHRNQWGTIDDVRSALVQLPLARLLRLFTTRTGSRSSVDGDEVQALVAERGDPAEALMAAAQSLVGQGDSDTAQLRVALAQAAIAAFAARGAPIPEALDTLVEE